MTFRRVERSDLARLLGRNAPEGAVGKVLCEAPKSHLMPAKKGHSKSRYSSRPTEEPGYIHTYIHTYVYVYVYIIYHCGCTALPTRRLDHLIFVVRKTRNPLQLWDAPCSFQRVIHFSCGVEGSPRFLSSRQKRLYISSSCRHRCGTELIVLDLELPPRISSVLQLLHHPLSTHEYF